MPQRSYIHTILLGILSLFLVACMVFFPKQAFQSSLEGLEVWWEVVFPALLPFFIASELLMGFGVVHFLGVFLEPLMRPIFKIPGTGGFVLSMGLASGYPIGAKLTARLREQKLISRAEGERLVSFANTADPLFMFGAVAVGFFHDVTLGLTLAAAHYSAALLVGLTMRFHDPKGSETPSPSHSEQPILIRALKAMHQARLKDRRTFGTLMGDAITSSVNTLMMIGGFIIMFSVLINIMTLTHINALLSGALAALFQVIGMPAELAQSVIAGFFEITLGSKEASQAGTGGIARSHQIAVVSAIVAWSGMSVHAQVASILSKTDIRYAPYLFARFLHAVFAGVITLIVWEPIQNRVSQTAVPVFFHQVPEGNLITIWERFSYLGSRAALLMAAFCFVALAFYWKDKIASAAKKPR